MRKKLLYAALAAVALAFHFTSYAQKPLYLGKISEVAATYRKQALTASNPSLTALVAHSVPSKAPIQLRLKSTKKEGTTESFFGEVANTRNSNFFLQVSAGKASGAIIMRDQKKYYRYSSTADGSLLLTEEDIDKVLCVGIPLVDNKRLEQPEKRTPLGGPSGAPEVSAAVPIHESLPGSAAVMYLDFDGQTVTGTLWNSNFNSGNPIVADPSTLSEAEITAVWKMMAEDYRPFNINVTTNLAAFNAAAINRRMRVIFTPTDYFYPGAGGVAYIGSFTWGGTAYGETPCWVWNIGIKGAGEAGSHEGGHTLHLGHDGRTTPSESYFGGQDQWAPIMGVGYYVSQSQWSKGEYPFANNTEDDLAKIATMNGFGYRADDHGNDLASATPIVKDGSGEVLPSSNRGVISTRTDVDVFSIAAAAGPLSLTVNPDPEYPDLDVYLTLRNSAGTVVATADPATVGANITTIVTAGTYYLTVDGVVGALGANTDYASLGAYSISGPTYCIPGYSTGCAANDFINNFSFATINNVSSGCSSGSSTGYTTYPATGTLTTSVTRGSTYAFSMQSGASYPQGFAMWIDYNRDKDFDDAGEFIYASPSAATTAFSGNITIPATAGLGATRLRVRCRYNAVVGASESCASFSYGEAEDYTVNILGSNQLPTVTLTAPVAGASFFAPASIPITATAADADGTVSKVEFYNGAVKIGEDLTSPYAYNWNGVGLGTYVLTAKATDNSGGTKTSTPVNVEVAPSSTVGNPITGFGDDGIVKSNLYHPGGAAGAGKTFVQADGKLLVVLHEGGKTTIKRFLANGAIDPDFDLQNNGEAIDLEYRDAAITASGKVIIVGVATSGVGKDFGIASYEDGGSYTLTKTTFGSNTEGATAIAIQSNGKFVVAGFTTVSGTPRFALARYNADLTLDPTFSGDGKQTTAPPSGGAIATDVVIQVDGKIVLGGHGGAEDGSAFQLARYSSTGSLDVSFSGDGKQSTAIGAVGSSCTGLALQSDGKIIATGRTKLTAGAGSNYDFATARYTTTGTLDATFDGDGIATTSIGGVDWATGALVQTDNKIVISGRTGTGTTTDFALLRYTASGALDAGFSGDGKQTTDFNGREDHAIAAALQADGKVVLAGFSDPTGGRLREIALARYTTAGAPDVSFSGDGKAEHYFSSGRTRYNSIVVQADGKIIAGGMSRSNYFYDGDGVDRYALARYNADGTLDPSFGIAGKRTTTFPVFGGQGKSLGLQSDGKVLLGGDFLDFSDEFNSGGTFAIARYKTNGSLDSTYGTDGIATTSFVDELGDKTNAGLSSIAVQADGKVIALGTSEGPETERTIALARYNTNGSHDATFNGDGMLTTSFGLTNLSAGAVVVQSDGKIVIAGGSNGNFLVARFNANGSPDLTFSGDGVQVTDFFSTTDKANTLALQPDGKIVVSGTSNGNFATARYLPNGDLDLSFNVDGRRSNDFESASDVINGVAVQPDGKIIVAGTNGSQFTFARYLPNGDMDLSFSGDGKQYTDIDSGPDELSGIARSGSTLYAVGTSDYAPFDAGITLGVLVAYDLGIVNPPVTTKSIKLNLYGGSNPYVNAEWNNWNVSGSLNSGVLNYSDGAASGVSAAITKHTLADNGAAYGGTMCPPEVLRYASYSTTTRTLTFSGLSTTKSYSLELYASRANTGNSTTFTINGNAVTILTDNNKTNKAVYSGLTPTAGGQIVISLASVNTYNYLNGLILTESAAPPPVTKLVKVNLYGGSNPFANPEWNNWNVSGSLSSGALAYSDASSSGISASITKHTLADNGAAYGGTMCPPEVLRYASYSTTTRSMTLSGLAPSKTYSLQLFASRANTGNSTTFTIGATSVTILTDNNKTNVASFSSLVPSAGGQIVLSIASVNTYNYLNGFILTENAAPAPPAAVLLTGTLPGGNTSEGTVAAQAPGARKGSFESAVRGLQVRAFPNPSSEHFTFVVQSSEGGSVDLRIVDAVGRVVERKQNIAPNTTLTMGRGLKAGSYFLQAVQGSQTRSIKLLRKE